jgi:hypothetical protein
VQANAAKKAAKAQSKSADQATQLQKEMFDQITANYAPFLKAGKQGMAAYLYEMGLAGKPTFGMKPAMKIEEIDLNVGQRRDSDGNVIPGQSNTKGYKVGTQTFSTLGEAQAYQKEQQGGRQYEGYSMSPMAKYLMQEGMEGIEGGAAASGGLFSGATLEALEGNRRQVVQADTSDYMSRLLGLTNMGMGAAGNQASAGQNYANNVGNLAMQAGNAKAQGYMGVGNAISGFMGDAAGIYGYFNNPMQAYASPTMATGQAPKPNPFY